MKETIPPPLTRSGRPHGVAPTEREAYMNNSGGNILRIFFILKKNLQKHLQLIQCK